MKNVSQVIFLTIAGLIVPEPRTAKAQVEPMRLSGTGKELSPAEMREDFDRVRHALEEAHPGLYRYLTKTEMDHSFDTQRAKLNRGMMKGNFEVAVTEMLALIRCGHTSLNHDEERVTAMKHARTFPLRVLIEGRQLMVLFKDTPDDRMIRPGMVSVAKIIDAKTANPDQVR